MSRGRPQRGEGDFYFVGLACFALIAVAFWLFGEVVGVRMLGLVMLGQGAYFVIHRRVPYGVEGKPPAGYLSGWAAVAVGVLGGLIGLALIAWPRAFLVAFG